MFKQIVVGVDEHRGARDAIALANNLLAPGGELTLAYILAHDGPGHGVTNVASEASGWDQASELLEKVRDEAGVDAQLRWRVAASVGRGLRELCEVTGADLLVVGSSSRGLAGRVLLGDDTQAVLEVAPCAIAIAPSSYSHEPVAMLEIGVGYNGTPESAHALELARRIAAGTGAKLSAFEAVSLSTSRFEARLFRLSDAVDALVNEAMERIRALGAVHAHVAYGEPAEELALYSASLDLLIVGSRGYGRLGRLIHGSTSRKLAHTARCPLLVLPRSARAIAAGEAEKTGRESAAAVRG
jgi:nucleotide-binding universal stress UspA family protein